MSKAPYNAMIAYISFTWLFPSQITSFQEQSWIKQIVEWNALFKIFPQDFFF